MAKNKNKKAKKRRLKKIKRQKNMQEETNRTLVISDIHGGYKSLIQCLKKSKFDYKKDTLICLGDVVDGWPETPQCIEELLKIKNLIYITGNHDIWVDDWFKSGQRPIIWTEQGGRATINAYLKHGELRVKHTNFFDNAVNYHITKDNKLFVHGGCNPKNPVDKQDPDYLRWDRDLFLDARWNQTVHKKYDEIYIGHTTTWSFSHHPIKRGNVWMMDQGGGYEGRLSILDIDTKKFWQSDNVDTLYPGHMGRN